MKHTRTFCPQRQDYICARCGNDYVQLWRSSGILINPEFICGTCLHNDELDEKSRIETEKNAHGVELITMSWFEPAIPTKCKRTDCKQQHTPWIDDITQEMMTWWHAQEKAPELHPQELFFH